MRPDTQDKRGSKAVYTTQVLNSRPAPRRNHTHDLRVLRKQNRTPWPCVVRLCARDSVLDARAVFSRELFLIPRLFILVLVQPMRGVMLHQERVGLCVEDPLVERQDVLVREQQVEILEHLGHEEGRL